jgi:tRNA (cytidine/uridine-2'-O-)-methyltransferase
MHIVLFEPEIPPNTGNIIRLCANTNTRLHLIQPLGFSLKDSKLKRAGLDYHECAQLEVHQDFEAFQQKIIPANIYACSTKGTQIYSQVNFSKEDALLFGPESRGLPTWLLERFPKKNIIKIPMQPHSRSLNLSNAVAIILYEAYRQLGFNF